FFMLLVNFSVDNYDQRVRLPVAGTARPVEEGAKAAEDRLVLNGDKQGHLLINGEVMPTHKAIAESKDQAGPVQPYLNAARQRPGAHGAVPTTIVWRADKDTPFSLLYSLISACQANGFFKFALKAMNAS